MATLQKERDMYAAMFGEDAIVEPAEYDVTLDSYDEAVGLYEDMLHQTLMFRPEDKNDIALLKKEIQECKTAKRELFRALQTEQRGYLTA